MIIDFLIEGIIRRFFLIMSFGGSIMNEHSFEPITEPNLQENLMSIHLHNFVGNSELSLLGNILTKSKPSANSSKTLSRQFTAKTALCLPLTSTESLMLRMFTDQRRFQISRCSSTAILTATIDLRTVKNKNLRGACSPPFKPLSLDNLNWCFQVFKSYTFKLSQC
jgi:hypothetical protein